MTGKRIIVVGAGIIGASIAWHLAKAGAEVTVLEAGEPGGVATRNSWAWINASWGSPEVYFRLRARSMLEWQRIDRDVPGLDVSWCGGLIWDLPPDQLEAFAVQHISWGYGIRRVNRAEALRIEPNIKKPPDFALHVAKEGKVEPLATALAFLASAEAMGVKVLRNSHAKWLAEKNGHITGVCINEGVLHADEVVIAAGAGAATLLKSIGLSYDIGAPAGLLVHSKPMGEILHTLLMTPELHVRQTSEGRLVAGADFSGSDPADDPRGAAAALYQKVQDMVIGAEHVEIDFHTVGFRPTPGDDFPMIGRPQNREGLYITVMHSGITLAPAVGLFATAELMDGKRDPLIAPYHPDRLLKAK
jgi:glycine/D-amino acid oxidase-like deaminating enzyme